jgi:hypothetical protein
MPPVALVPVIEIFVMLLWGQSDGENQANTDFKNHIELNDNPLTAQDQQYSEGYNDTSSMMMS